jgi:spore germination protein KA
MKIYDKINDTGCILKNKRKIIFCFFIVSFLLFFYCISNYNKLIAVYNLQKSVEEKVKDMDIVIGGEAVGIKLLATGVLVVGIDRENIGIEVLNINTALIRKYVNDSNLIIEKIPIGKRSKNSCVVMYINNLTNMKIVKKLKNRITNIDTDIILTTDNLSQFIETNTFSIIPQIMPTEKPDRVASFLMQGRCVILTNNSPIAGVIPTTIIDWFHSSEDGYLRTPFNFILKLIRIAAIIISLFLPALYIATVTYHIDILPTNIAMMLAASRDAVPFPFVVEVIFMEIAFELLREAETRVPTKVGPIVSIVGGLILGQIAVEANIICSFTMIIVGFTGICMYALPNYYSSYGLRNMRYILIILSFANGYLALSFGVFIFLLILANSYSIGTRLLPSFYIDKNRNVIQQIFTEPVWKRENRPYYTKAKDKTSQPSISRRWLFNEKK